MSFLDSLDNNGSLGYGSDPSLDWTTGNPDTPSQDTTGSLTFDSYSTYTDVNSLESNPYADTTVDSSTDTRILWIGQWIWHEFWPDHK